MNILILGHNFFGYEKEYLEEIKKRYNAIYINLQITFIERIYLFVIKKLFGEQKREVLTASFYNKKIKKELKNINIGIDILFVINLLDLKKENFSFIESNYKIKEKWLYLWDDISRVKKFEEFKQNFNKIYSFDKKDSLDNNLIYRPTFYSKRLESLKKNKVIYQTSFVGIYSIERNKILNNIIKKVFKNNFIYLYLDFFKYIKDYFFSPNYKLKDIKFIKVSKENYNFIMSQSEIIIDLIQSEFNQTGVTQRTLDALYLGKKIITNNKYVKNYEFYNSNNILIIDENTTKEEIIEFKNKEYVNLDKNIISYYSVEQWVKDIFK